MGFMDLFRRKADQSANLHLDRRAVAMGYTADLVAARHGWLGQPVTLDVHRALQSFDAGGSARALAGIMQALATAKDAGLSDAAVAAAFGALDWSEARPNG